jgi:hypothetical protein
MFNMWMRHYLSNPVTICDQGSLSQTIAKYYMRGQNFSMSYLASVRWTMLTVGPNGAWRQGRVDDEWQGVTSGRVDDERRGVRASGRRSVGASGKREGKRRGVGATQRRANWKKLDVVDSVGKFRKCSLFLGILISTQLDLWSTLIGGLNLNVLPWFDLSRTCFSCLSGVGR